MSNAQQHHPIFIVDDEPRLLDGLTMTLASAGIDNVAALTSGEEVLALLPDPGCALLLLDLFMPSGVSGETVLERFRAECPNIPVVVITGVDETETAVRCMRAGAFDYLVKPVEPELLIATVRRAVNHFTLVRQNAGLREKLLHGSLDHPEAFAHVLTVNQRMQSIFKYLEVVAPASDPVLITGETGTGKELLAAALHQVSGRQGPFLSLNAAGLDDNMFADTLFGHVKGAFTDAGAARQGLVDQAAHGTLLLDEIGDLSPASQVKLLKLIQDREFYPLGADRPCRCRARIVAATNRDLEAAWRAGAFRKDLFFRINTYHVHLPPLRERREDVPLLARHFLEQACREIKSEPEPIDSRLETILRSYAYPGNVRELRALIFNAVAHGGLKSLERGLRENGNLPLLPAADPPASDGIRFPDPLPSLETAVRELVREALRRAGGNQAAAARMLGITRQAMHQRIRQMRDMNF